MGFGVRSSGFGFRVWVLGTGIMVSVLILGFWVQSSEFGVEGVGFSL